MLSHACGLHATLAQTPASLVVMHDAASTGASVPPSPPDPELLLPLLLLPDELPLLELDEPELLPLLDPLPDPEELPPLEPPLLLEEPEPFDPLSLQPVPAIAAASAIDATAPPTKTKRSFMLPTVAPAAGHGSHPGKKCSRAGQRQRGVGKVSVTSLTSVW